MITVRIMLEILGKPQLHVEETLQNLSDKLTGDERYTVRSKDLAKVKEIEDGIKEGGSLWSTFGEFEVLVKNPSSLVELCFEYMPSNIEVIDPDKIEFNHEVLSHLLNTLQSRLHQVDMVSKKVHNENTFLKRNMNLLMYNFLRVLITQEKRTLKNLSKLTGVDEKRLGMYLDKMVDDKRIELVEGVYKLL